MSRPMSSLPAGAPHARLDVDYVQADSPDALLQGDDVLAVLGFGNDAPRHGDPRYLRVPLQPYGAAPFEVWRTRSPVSHGREGDIAWASDGQLSFGVI
jgi:chorismate lyase/3-hydroxybenzoate synthase